MSVQEGTERPDHEQVFLESGTWVKPDGAKWVRIELVGGIGGDASDGQLGDSGELIVMEYPADELPDEVGVVVGRSGTALPRDSVASGHGWARITSIFRPHYRQVAVINGTRYIIGGGGGGAGGAGNVLLFSSVGATNHDWYSPLSGSPTYCRSCGLRKGVWPKASCPPEPIYRSSTWW